MQSGAPAEPPEAPEAPARPTVPETPAPRRDDAEVVQFGAVVVTGSHLRGVANDTAPLTTFDRDYIERSGYGNMMQLVESLPMNFKGGASGASEVGQFGEAPFYGQNLNRGTGFNLRGLGSASTLTLINGRRVAPSAHGQFVDVSTIPLSAVERVEILGDGASAIYGADAVAGVVNIILRQDFDGAEAALQAGSATDGATRDGRASLTSGHSWDGGSVLVVGEYYRREPLDILDRDYIVAAGLAGPTWLLPRREAGSLMVSGRQLLPGGFDAAADLLYSHERVDTLDTTAGTSTQTQDPVTNRWSVAFGLGYEPSDNWRFALDGNAGRVHTRTDWTYTSVATGEVLMLIRDYDDRFDTWSLEAKADGTLATLPGGPVRLAVGGGYREDDLLSTRVRAIPDNGFQVRADDARQVAYAFSELHVPLLGRHQEVRWARRLELSLAARYDDYSDFGSSANPRVGLVWSPSDRLDLRASYSTSFRAPSMAEKALATRGQISSEWLDAPDGSGAQVPVLVLSGSAPLAPEESENLAIGFTYRPAPVPGLELGVNWFDIDYTDRIASPPYDAGMLARRDEFGDLIADLPDDAAAQAYLAQRIAAGDLYIDRTGTGAAGVHHLVDARQKNAARVRTSGFDLTARYGTTVGRDSFDLQFNATHLRELLTSLTADSTAFDRIDTYNQPLDWRLRAVGTWQRGGFGLTVGVSHADGYVNDSQAVDVPIDAWTTVDVNASYAFGEGTRFPAMRGVRASLGVSNLLDVDPPRAISPRYPVGYDAFNADPVGRYVSARLAKRW
nr:TonB-dependent receptor [Luteimonas sp. XNQY3]